MQDDYDGAGSQSSQVHGVRSLPNVTKPRRPSIGGAAGNPTGPIRLPPWQPKGGGVPTLLRSTYDEDFVDARRRERLNQRSGRPRSEVGELLGSASSRLHQSFTTYSPAPGRQQTIPYGSVSGSNVARRSNSFYERPRSSFEPAQYESATNQRVLRQRNDGFTQVDRQQPGHAATNPLNAPQPFREEGHGYSDEDYAEEYEEEDYISEEDELQDELDMYYRRGQRDSSRSFRTFTEADIHSFGVIQLSSERARAIVARNPPPAEFWHLNSYEKTAFLYYYTLYKQYVSSVKNFHNIFNREFYKYTAAGESNNEALLKICKHTRKEFDIRRQRANKLAYDRSRQHLFSDDRATPDSRASDRPSYCERLDESDIASLDSSAAAKEPLRFARPHAFATFAPGGRLLVLNPEYSISTIRVEEVKSHIQNSAQRRNIEAMEAFKGPLINGITPSHTPLLFIDRQIERILQSEIYLQNPESSDANDVLLIWRLLEMLIRQHGKVTGPDLARLLTANYKYSSQSFQPKNSYVRGKPDRVVESASPALSIKHRDERYVDPDAMDKFTRFLLGGYIDEAIESATQNGLLFDALILAYRMFGHDRRKLELIESRLLAHRDPQHPALTLLSVASQMPVPILTNMTNADDAFGWRGHIAIVLANLNTETSMYTVHQLGLALSRKHFDAAADFCFLAVNLLIGQDCFAPVERNSEDEEAFRRHITLVNASLPDDAYYSTETQYDWSITDFQATEIYAFARRMSLREGETGILDRSTDFQRCRIEYAELLAENGISPQAAYDYCFDVANNIKQQEYNHSSETLFMLCDLAERLAYAANHALSELTWIQDLRSTALNRASAELQEKASAAAHAAAAAAAATQYQGNDTSFVFPPPNGNSTSTPIGNTVVNETSQGNGYLPEQVQPGNSPVAAPAPAAVGGYPQQQAQAQQQYQSWPSVTQPQPVQQPQPTQMPAVFQFQPQPGPPPPPQPMPEHKPFVRPEPIAIGRSASGYNQDNFGSPLQTPAAVSAIHTSTDSQNHQRSVSPAYSIVSNATLPPVPVQDSVLPGGLEELTIGGDNESNNRRGSSAFAPMPHSPHGNGLGPVSRSRTVSQSSVATLGSPTRRNFVPPQFPGPPANANNFAPAAQPSHSQASVGAGEQPSESTSTSSISTGPPPGFGAPQQQQQQWRPPPQPHQQQQQQQQQAMSYQQTPQQQKPNFAQPPQPMPMPPQQPAAPLQQQQHQQQQQQQQRQQQAENVRQQKNEAPGGGAEGQANNAGSGGGFLSSVKSRIAKMIPSSGAPEMVLPNDSSPAIRWDEKLGRYVGEGIEYAPPPPPPPPSMPDPSSFSAPGGNFGPGPNPPTGTNTLVGRRRAGPGARYANAFATMSSGGGEGVAPPGAGMAAPIQPPLPPTFGGFMPVPVDDGDSTGYSDPFSSAPVDPAAAASADQQAQNVQQQQH